MEQAQGLLTSTSCSDEFLDNIALSREDVLARDWHGRSAAWILARHRDVEEEEHGLAAFHLTVSTRMATHLALTVENFMTAEYQAAAILSTDPFLAQESARFLHDHLRRKPIVDMNSFERVVRTDEVLWMQLDRFADHEYPTLVWRQGGSFRELFSFLAVRFLANGDSVLNAESIHSRWQHLLRMKHAIKHPLLSSILKVGFAFTDGAGVPEVDDILPHFSRVRQEHYQGYRAAAVTSARGQGWWVVVVGALTTTTHHPPPTTHHPPPEARPSSRCTWSDSTSVVPMQCS